MLSPRHHALVATLAGMTVGITVFVAVLAINSDAGTEAAAGPTTTSVASPTPKKSESGLQADGLQYTRKTFGKAGTAVAAEVPAEWILKPTSGWRHRYVDPSDTWLIRFNPKASKQSPEELAGDRRRSVSAEKNFKAVDVVNGTEPVSWNPDELNLTTLIYTYTDGDRTTGKSRMVLSRWVSIDGGKRSSLEITVAGQPQDASGLRAVLDHATRTLELSKP